MNPFLRTPAERVSIAACSRILASDPDEPLSAECHAFIIDPSPANALAVVNRVATIPPLIECLEPPYDQWSPYA